MSFHFLLAYFPQTTLLEVGAALLVGPLCGLILEGAGAGKWAIRGRRRRENARTSWEGSWVSTAARFCIPRFLWFCISEPGSALCLWPTHVECFVPTAVGTFTHMLSFVHTKLGDLKYNGIRGSYYHYIVL